MKGKMLTATAYPPPPPPQSSPKKDSRKLIVVALLIVIIVVSAGVLVYLATRPSSTGSPTPTPTGTATPTPTGTGATPTPTGTATPTPTQTNPVAGASSMKFSVSYTSGNASHPLLFGYTYSAKNIGTSNMMMRIEGVFSEDGETMIYIVNGALQQAWMYSDGEWMDLSSAFTSQWSNWNSTWQGYESSLAGWAGSGEYTYTYPTTGDTLRIYDIQVNPALADSLFTHS
jgi:hypothetical protein